MSNDPLLTYWRESLAQALEQVKREPIAACRAITRERIANYRRWIALAEMEVSQ